jgi:hypothetical protein
MMLMTQKEGTYSVKFLIISITEALRLLISFLPDKDHKKINLQMSVKLIKPHQCIKQNVST